MRSRRCSGVRFAWRPYADGLLSRNMVGVVEAAGLARAHVECARLKDGRDVRIRPTSPADLDALRTFFAALSPETLRLRFLYPLREVQESRLRELAIADHRSQVVLVAEPCSVAVEQMTDLLAEARYVRSGDSDSAELALVVADAWRRVGLGTLLMRALLWNARRAGLRHLLGEALTENTAIQGLLRSFGARITSPLGSNTVQLCVETSSGRRDRNCNSGRAIKPPKSI